MAKVHILNVSVHNNPSTFYTPFQFEIHFECLEDLQDDLEFKIIYVGSAETYEFDQVLDQIVVDAVPQGQFKFMFQADPPDIKKIPSDDAVGVTVVLITASYRQQEFVRVGYYVTNEYDDLELKEQPPSEPLFDKLVRTIAANEPRVTKFKINWDNKTNEQEQQQQHQVGQENNDIVIDKENINSNDDIISINNNTNDNSNSKLGNQQQQQQQQHNINGSTLNDIKNIQDNEMIA